MAALDHLNSRYGRDTLTIRTAGRAEGWKLRSDQLLQAYTTRWGELYASRMTAAEIITAALSALRLGVAGTALRRTFAIERPLAWLTLEPTEEPSCWLVYINLRNRSQTDLKPNSVSVTIDSVTEPRKQRFYLLEYVPEQPINVQGLACLKLPLSGDTIAPGATGKMAVVLRRSPLATASKAALTFRFHELKSTPAYHSRTLTVSLPEGGLILKLH